MRFVAAALAAVACVGVAWAEPRPADMFSDHMVLQRDAPIRVWGDASPGENLTVRLGNSARKTRAGRDGRWSAELPARGAGGPYTLVVEGDGAKATIEDVLVGDVWLCSGQSNMEWPVERALSPQEAIDGPHDPRLRLLTLERKTAAVPQDRLAGAPKWRTAGPDSVRYFSAACYFFARELAKSVDAPLGLVHSSWGGSQIEAWLSAPSLRAVGGFDAELDLLARYAADPVAATTDFGSRWESWWRAGVGTEPWSPSFDDSAWRPLSRLGRWNGASDAGLPSGAGTVWYRKRFTLAAAPAGETIELALGGVDQVDNVWVNGRYVGGRFGWGDPRVYAVPSGYLRAGENVVAVAAHNPWGPGGLMGPASDMRLGTGEAAVPLSEGWIVAAAPDGAGQPPRAPWEPIFGMTGLANAMIAPMDGARFAGAFWYQGEANGGRGAAYEGLLSALVREWRGRFGATLPVIVTQLPGYGAPTLGGPSDSGWARLRDSQRRVAVADPRVGLVTTIDAGDRWDIHPPNKQIVGRRAAAVALALARGDGPAADGFSPRQAVRREDVVVVTLPAERVRVSGDDRVAGVELCAADGACRYAPARLTRRTLEIEVGAGATPTHVRYAWSDVPVVSLYGPDGAPVTPFELRIE